MWDFKHVETAEGDGWGANRIKLIMGRQKKKTKVWENKGGGGDLIKIPYLLSSNLCISNFSILYGIFVASIIIKTIYCSLMS